MKTINRYLKFVLPVVLTAVLAVACSSSKNQEGAFIPKDAYFVADINVGSMWQKGELTQANDLNSIQMLHSFLAVSAPEFDKILEEMIKDPSSCGIDMDRNIAVFMSDNNGRSMAVVNAALKDQKVFEDFLATVEKTAGGMKTAEESGRKVTVFGNEFIAAYDETNVVFVFNADGKTDIETQKSYATTLYDLDKDNSMLADKHYGEYKDLRHDINFYAHYANLMKLTGGAASMTQMQAFLPKEDYDAMQQAAICYTVSFENGSIDVNGSYLGTPAGLQKIADQKFNAKLVDYMPEQTLVAFTFALSPSGLIDYLGSIPSLKPFLGNDTGYGSIKDIVTAFGGSFIGSFYGMENNTPLFAAACDINNEELVSEMLEDMGLGTTGVIPGSPVKYILTNGAFVISTDDAVITAAANGGFGNGLNNIADKAKNGNYFYLDLKIQDYPEELVSQLGVLDPVATMLLGMLDFAEAYSDNTTTGTFKLHLANSNANSLAYTIQTIDQVAGI